MKDPKKLTKLKLNKLVHDTLENRHMNVLRGGADGCGCPCAYEGTPKGSTVEDNMTANKYEGPYNPGYKCNQACSGHPEEAQQVLHAYDSMNVEG